MRKEVLAVAESPASDAEKKQSEYLIQKIGAFSETQRRLQVANQPTATQIAQQNSGDTQSGDETPVGTGVDDDKAEYAMTYDAHGWLNEMVRDGGQSKNAFVLQDKNKKVLYHVQPAPGVNLHRYLKKKVGVIGRRGFHQQLQIPHVTADRVIVLDTKTR